MEEAIESDELVGSSDLIVKDIFDGVGELGALVVFIILGALVTLLELEVLSELHEVNKVHSINNKTIFNI